MENLLKLSNTSLTTYKLKKVLKNQQFKNIKLTQKGYLDTYQQTLQCISIRRLDFKMFSRSQLAVAAPRCGIFEPFFEGVGKDFNNY